MRYQNYISLGVLVGIAYAFFGIYSLHLYSETAILAAVVIFITSILPEIDAGKGPSTRELGGLLAAIAPLAILQAYPSLQTAGVSRLALVVVVSYVTTRIIATRLLASCTSPMGMIHSIPAAVVTFEAVFLLFSDLYVKDRLFVAGAAFIGYFAHLLIDAYSNLDLFGKATGEAKRAPRALKFFGDKATPTIITYGSLLVLGWFVLRDLYPDLKLFAGVQY